MPRYGKLAQEKVERAMHEMKHGTLSSGKSGKKVTDRKQAIAIGLSEAKEKGGKVPAKPATTKKPSATTAAKKSSTTASSVKKKNTAAQSASAATKSTGTTAKKTGTAAKKSSTLTARKTTSKK